MPDFVELHDEENQPKQIDSKPVQLVVAKEEELVGKLMQEVNNFKGTATPLDQNYADSPIVMYTVQKPTTVLKTKDIMYDENQEVDNTGLKEKFRAFKKKKKVKKKKFRKEPLYD